VTDQDKRRLNRHLDRWQERIPGWAGRVLRWLRKPSSRWVRIPVGVALVCAGLLGFLPVLGLWMLLPGLLLLALDLPFLRRPMRWLIVRGKRWSHHLRLRWRQSHR